MAVDKLVDSTQLDSDLTSVANAIRTKSGGSGQLAFPSGFVSEIGNIPSGGDTSIEDSLITGANFPSVYENSRVTSVRGHAFDGVANFTKLSLPEVTSVSQYSFYSGKFEEIELPKLTGVNGANFRYCSRLKKLFLPSLTDGSSSGDNYSNCTSLKTAVFPKMTTGNTGNGNFNNDSALEAVDFGGNITSIGTQNTFLNCGNLQTIVLRGSTIAACGNVNNFSGSPFKSGGTGGTIYIPKSLYDHLGDGSSSDYKAATNWSTINGYGTITWAKIEGSIYETQYVDGTPIPSS